MRLVTMGVVLAGAVVLGGCGPRAGGEALSSAAVVEVPAGVGEAACEGQDEVEGGEGADGRRLKAEYGWLLDVVEDEATTARDVVALVAGLIAGASFDEAAAVRVEVGEVAWDRAAGSLTLHEREGQPALRVGWKGEGGEPRSAVLEEALVEAVDERALRIRVAGAFEPSVALPPLPGVRVGAFEGDGMLWLDEGRLEVEASGPEWRVRGAMQLVGGRIEFLTPIELQVTIPPEWAGENAE